jgi:hypothetical protein
MCPLCLTLGCKTGKNQLSLDLRNDGLSNQILESLFLKLGILHVSLRMQWRFGNLKLDC